MTIKRVLVGLLAALLLLAAVLVVNTLRQDSRQVQVNPLPRLAVNEARLAETMAAAVRARTVSGLLDPAGAAAEPFALLAHQDVVPIAPGTEALWKKPPFAGVVEDGLVWGRGTLDNKSNLVTQMEAVELLLKAGFKPRRTVYLIAGHDEEVGGQRGAIAIVDLFKQRGVKLEYVIDEGLAVTEGILPGDTVQGVAEHVKRAVADERIVIQPLGLSFEASSVSSPEAPAFKLIERTAREVFPDAVVAPGLMLAGSDARHFQAVAHNAYRFMPIRFKPEDLPRVHGTDERISVQQLADMVRFYHRLLQQSAQ